MKNQKINSKIITLVLMVGFLVTFPSCKKENIRWIIGGHRYVVHSIFIQTSTGWKNIKDVGFGFADKITFFRNDLTIDGDITIIDNNYTTTDYSLYGWIYDQYNNCYYYSDQSYSIVYSRAENSVFHYKWSYKSDRVMNIIFSEIDPILNKVPGTTSLLSALNGDYVVEKDSRKKGQLYAGVITLTKGNVRMILEY